MRLPDSAASRSRLKFNITPLIDVVFLLIIFFLVASHFVRNEVAEAVDLPLAESARPDAAVAAGRLTITIARDGQLSVSGKPIDPAAVEFRIAELAKTEQAGGEFAEVRIRADRAARYGSVRRIIEVCAKNQINSIQFAVIDPVTAQ
jgi:biopolymer transport protein ExbD